MSINAFRVMGLVGLLATELSAAAADGKVTVKEGITIIEKVCGALGIDFDKEGVDLSKL